MTLLARLEKRGSVTRRKPGRSYIYRPRVSRDTMREHALKQLLHGFFDGSAAARTAATNVVVRKGESMTNQSVTGIVTSKPGTYQVTFALTATIADAGTKQPIRQSVQVVVK